MAFSIRQIISNIPYFKKSEHDNNPNSEILTEKAIEKCHKISVNETVNILPKNSSKKCNTDANRPKSSMDMESEPLHVKSISLSQTNLVNIDFPSSENRNEAQSDKKLKLNINKAAKLGIEIANKKDLDYKNGSVDNTPVHLTLQSRNSEMFSERLKEFDLSRSYDIFDLMHDENLSDEIHSLSEHSDDDSIVSDKNEVKMCRKVRAYDGNSSGMDNQMVHSSSIESFADVELDKNEEERVFLLNTYNCKIEKMHRLLSSLLNEFQFHIEVTKVFNTKTVLSSLPGRGVTALAKNVFREIACYNDTDSGSESPAGEWNIVMESVDTTSKFTFKRHLNSIKCLIEEFMKRYLTESRDIIHKPVMKAIDTNKYDKPNKFITEVKKLKVRRLKINEKKRDKRINNFPDLKETLEKLFSLEVEYEDCSSVEAMSEYDETDIYKCTCKCRYHNRGSPSSQADSGLLTKDDKSQSITSSIGNFSLNTLSLSAYSESLENIISYNSFNESSLYNTILQKAAVERITFYVQVHSIQLTSDSNDLDFESKPALLFTCHSCSVSEENEHDLLKHILSQEHCEKIHFLYKTAYIKQCFAAGKEIQPSTVLNPMTMYRDDNKIVCFGDGVFACTLCLENMIIGESVLMAHCAKREHLERKERLLDILDETNDSGQEHIED